MSLWPHGARIAVGSRNRSKVEAVRAVLDRLSTDYAVVPVAAVSGVAAQPLSDEETRRGAIQRAQEALRSAGAWAAFGLEGGVDRQNGEAWMVNWCALVTADGLVALGRGASVCLPLQIGQRLAPDRELGPLIDELSGIPDSNQHLGAFGFLTRNLVDRRAMWEQAVACALAPLLHPELYRQS